MRVFLSWFVLGLATITATFASNVVEDDYNTEINALVSFPEDNPFGHIVNGERNRVQILVENNSELNVTLISASASFHDVQSNELIKNASTLPYGLRLISGTKLQLPYAFHSEFKPGDIRLNIWLTYSSSSEADTRQVTVYNSVVTIVEPEVSIFDYQVITTYLLTAAFLGALGYYVYISFLPKAKKARKPVTSSDGKKAVNSPVGTVNGSGGGGYEEEWIPEHHLKGRTGKKKVNTLNSGDELSGEDSGSDVRKRRGRK